MTVVGRGSLTVGRESQFR